MIRIVIAEDQELLLGAMGSLLNLEEDMEVVGLASNGDEAISLVQQLQPDVCIMDIEMPEKSGLEAAKELQMSECKIIILTTFARTGYFRLALKANVRGYLLKDSPSEELASSIRSIMEGERIYSTELMDNGSQVSDEGSQTEAAVHWEKNAMGTVRKYLSTIIEKMKAPTG
jgi:two-component system, NarL family, response regulator DesR